MNKRDWHGKERNHMSRVNLAGFAEIFIKAWFTSKLSFSGIILKNDINSTKVPII